MASNTSPDTDVPSHRACVHCRSQKIRCIPDESNPNICQRCARSGKACVFTPLQKRRQRKRTDTRVAELEREMRAMRVLLKEKDQARKSNGILNKTSTTQASTNESRELGTAANDQTPFRKREYSAAAFKLPRDVQDQFRSIPIDGQIWPTQLPDWPKKVDRDIVDRGIISITTARQLLDTYRQSLFPHFPALVIPDNVTADELRVQHPTLFLAVVAAAAGRDDSDLSAILDQEILHAYAERSMVRSEKSVELVQAMLLSAAWYHPPAKFGQLKYYEYIHMATAMAMDIGIGTRPSTHRGRFGQSYSGRRNQEFPVHPIHHLEDTSHPDLSMTPRTLDKNFDTTSAESRRTLVACYVICASVSMSVRRPHTLRVSNYIRDCVTFFESSAHMIQSDKTLAMWARLVMIAEEISVSFSLDDPECVPSIIDRGAQLMMKNYAKRLSDWRASVSESDFHGTLAVQYWAVRILLHEIALHIDHSPEDFIAPYQMGPIKPWEGPDLPTEVLAGSIAECIDGSHRLLDAFLEIPPESARALPIFCYIRVSFASFVLAKLCLSVAHPGSGIGKVLERSNIEVESYMDKAVLHVRNVIGSTKSRVPAVFLAMLLKLRYWCLNPKLIDHADDCTDNGHATNASKSTQNTASLEWGSDATRFVEVDNGSETTPQSLESDSSQSGVPENLAVHESGDLPCSVLSAHKQTDTTTFKHAMTTQNVPANNMTAENNAAFFQGGIFQPQWFGPTDQMDIDQNFFQFFTEMNATAEGGLTGLDDWASMPANMTGVANLYNWQIPSGPNNNDNHPL